LVDNHLLDQRRKHSTPFSRIACSQLARQQRRAIKQQPEVVQIAAGRINHAAQRIVIAKTAGEGKRTHSASLNECLLTTASVGTLYAGFLSRSCPTTTR
jgi:hypothetical protein